MHKKLTRVRLAYIRLQHATYTAEHLLSGALVKFVMIMLTLQCMHLGVFRGHRAYRAPVGGRFGSREPAGELITPEPA